MAKQQRIVRMEQRGQLAAMQQLESRSDEELEAETRFKAAAQAILGARAAERYDAKAARDASLALAERRADDLKKAAERLGMEAPSNRQLFGLKAMGLIAPPKSAGILLRLRGIAIGIAIVIVVLAIGFGIAYGVGSTLGGISVDLAIFWGFVIVAVTLGVLAFVGRRKQKRALAERREQSGLRR
jgi:hypothetical protein